MSLTPEEMKMLGGSDLAALVGLNPYRSPFDVYARVVEGVETEDNKLLRRGRLMEPVIRTLAAEDLGLKLLGPRKLRIPELPFMRSSLDDVHQGADGEEPVELKSVSFFAADKYGEGGDEFPIEHNCQLQVYLHALRAPQGRLVALIGLDDLREYVLRADVEFQSLLLEAAERFWVNHVEKRVPPKVDASASCSEWLATRYPRNGGAMLKATPEADAAARRLYVARLAVEEAEAMEKEARNQLVAAIGEADGIEGAAWKVTHKLVKGRAKTDWEAVAKEAAVPSALVEKHTAVGAGYRRFVPKFSFPEEKQP